MVSKNSVLVAYIYRRDIRREYSYVYKELDNVSQIRVYVRDVHRCIAQRHHRDSHMFENNIRLPDILSFYLFYAFILYFTFL